MNHTDVISVGSAIQEPSLGAPESAPPSREKRLQHMNDIQLILVALAGSAEAFTELVEPHLHRFRIGIQRVLLDDASVQEALQAGLFVIQSELHTFQGRTSFPTWAFRICLNQALLVRRARERRKEESIEALMRTMYWEVQGRDRANLPMEELTVQAFEEWKGEHFWKMVHKALHHLSDEQRAVFILRDLDGMNTDEVARVLRLTRGLVRQHLHLARHRFRGVFANPQGNPGDTHVSGASMSKIDHRLHSN